MDAELVAEQVINADESLKAVPTDAPDSDFAYLPESGNKSERGLYCGDEQHVRLAVAAFTQGIMGQKSKIPEDKRAEVKGKLSAFINAKIPKEEQAYYHAWLDTGKKPDGDAASYGSSKAAGLPAASCAIKSLDDGDRFEGYLVVWGNPKQKDLTREYFDRRTEGLTELFDQLGRLPVLYHHGANKTVKASVVGMIDSLTPDEIGLFAEGELNKRMKYYEAVKRLLSSGALSWSSGALPGAVEKNRDGYIKRWVIAEGTMTPTPAEPRMTDIHFTSVKAVATAIDTLKIDIPEGLLSADDGSGRGQETARPDQLPGQPEGSAIKSREEMENVDSVDTEEQLSESIEDTSKAISEATKGVIGELDEMKKQFHQTMTASIVEQMRQLRGEITSTRKELDKVKGANKGLPAPRDNGTGRLEVLTATKYSSLSAPDMAFLYEVLSGHQKNWNPGEAFFRELADKTVKSVNKHELPYEALDGLIKQMGGTFKSNELDTVGQAGFGQEWAPDSWRAELWLRVRQDNVVAPLFDLVEMPTQPFELPIESGDPTVYFVPETTDAAQLVYGSGNPITLSKPGSGKVQLSSRKLALRVSWSSELNEDSLIPIVANYRRQSLRSMQNAIDNVLLNGDTAGGASVNVNLIDGTPTAGTKYLAFDGLRKYCLVTNTAQKFDGAGAVTLPTLRTGRFKLSGQYALQPRQCAWIVDDSTYGSMLNMPEFQTMDKAGNAATALTGQIGVVDGIPVVASAELGLSKGADGKISGTPANNTKGQAIIVFRPNWVIGYRRQVTAIVEYLSWADAYHLTVTARLVLASFNFDTAAAAEVFDLTV